MNESDLCDTEEKALVAIQGALCVKYASTWREAGYYKAPSGLEPYWNRVDTNVAFISKCYPKFIANIMSVDSKEDCQPNYSAKLTVDSLMDYLAEEADLIMKSSKDIRQLLDGYFSKEDDDNEIVTAAKRIFDEEYNVWSQRAYNKILRTKKVIEKERRTLACIINSAGQSKREYDTNFNPHFKYIDSMIDLRDDNICCILPYLLTAYICNSPMLQLTINRACPQESSPIEMMFSAQRILEDTEGEIEREIHHNLERLKTMSRFFSLSGYTITSGYKPKKKLVKVQFAADSNAPFHTIRVVDAIFKAWAIALFDYKAENIKNDTANLINKAVQQIDLAASYRLLLDRLEQFPDVFYGELLSRSAGNAEFLAEFRNEMEMYVI